MSVAYLGVPGAFSHEAALSFVPGEEPVGKPSFAAVVEALRSGEADYAVLPVESRHAGPVEEVRRLLGGAGAEVLGEHPLPIRLHLLGLPGSRLEGITTVVSHPMGFRQCAGSLERLGYRLEESDSTATAAKDLRDPRKAALASEAAARAYGLTILLRDVQDNADNITNFVVLARRGA